MSTTPAPSLTSLLVSASKPLFKAATQNPFLIAAGDGTLSKEKLSEWLSQDRLYAQAYIGFIGSLFAHVQLPTQHIPFSNHSDSIHWRISHMLKGALDNIFRELKFFEDTAQQYGLDLEATSIEGSFGPVQATTAYVNLFWRFSVPISEEDARGSNWVLLNGLIVLWATEKCYLEAWRFAASNKPDPTAAATLPVDGGALFENFIPNWTRQEFIDFVQGIEELVNELNDSISPSLSEEAQLECRELWEEVLDIERRFWPVL